MTVITMSPQFKAETTEKIRAIRDRLKTFQSRQKSYANLNRREVEYDVGDFVFLKVSPMHGVTQFGIKGKLDPRYMSLLTYDFVPSMINDVDGLKWIVILMVIIKVVCV